MSHYHLHLEVSGTVSGTVSETYRVEKILFIEQSLVRFNGFFQSSNRFVLIL